KRTDGPTSVATGLEGGSRFKGRFGQSGNWLKAKPCRRDVVGGLVLDQARLRGAKHHRRFAAETIDLGNEPPLSVDGGSGGLVDRRRVSVQWFSGTILTGLCGAALMGGAVFAALDGQTTFATVPERVEATMRVVGNIAERIANITRKTDRLP